MRRAHMSVFVIILSLILSCCQTTKNNKEYIYGNTSGNLTVNGRAVYNNGMILYNNILDISNDESGKLYKLTKSNGELTKLSDDSAYYINVVDDWIYFNNSSDNNYLYRIRIDGSQREMLVSGPVQFLSIVTDQAYFYDYQSCQIACIDLAGKNRRVLISDVKCSHLSVYENKLYYSDNYDDLYSIDVDAKSNKKLIKKGVSSFALSDGYMYFQMDSDFSLYRYKINENPNKIEDLKCKAEYYNVQDNWVYYYINGLWKTNGSETKKLSDSFGYFIYLCDDWIYGFSGLSLSNRAISRIKKDGSEFEVSKLNE